MTGYNRYLQMWAIVFATSLKKINLCVLRSSEVVYLPQVPLTILTIIPVQQQLQDHYMARFAGHERNTIVINPNDVNRRKTISPLPDGHATVAPVVLRQSGTMMELGYCVCFTSVCGLHEIILPKKGKIYLVEEMWLIHLDSTPH